MELDPIKRIPTAYEIALSRSRKFEGKEQLAHLPPGKAWVTQSEYDPNLFIENSPEWKKLADDYVLPDGRIVAVPSPPDPYADLERPPNYMETIAGEDWRDMPSLPDADPDQFPVKVEYAGPLCDYGGYARMNRTFVFGLREMGALVKTDIMDTITNVNERTEQALRSMSAVRLPPDCPKIYGMTVPDMMAHGGRKILFTMMETSFRVHPQYADRLNLADEIWTPTTWCKEVFEASGVYPPINVIPLGVDVSRYKPGLEPLPLKNLRTFRFISVFGWSYRKGFDVLLRAYLEEFGPQDDVSLVLSTRFQGNLSQRSHDRILQDFHLVRSMVDKQDHELPHIALHEAYTPEVDMPKLYNACHCFVLISRGEGFGLPYCEAGACGLPVIASDHGGQRDFLDDQVAYMVPPSGYYVSKREDVGFKNMAWISHFYENQEFPDYDDDARALLRHHMRMVFNDYEQAKVKADLFRQRLLNRFAWKHAVGKAYARLAEICEGL